MRCRRLLFCGLLCLSSRRRHTRCYRDWSSDVCSSDLGFTTKRVMLRSPCRPAKPASGADRKSTRLNSSHGSISYAVFCLKKTYTHRAMAHAEVGELGRELRVSRLDRH